MANNVMHLAKSHRIRNRVVLIFLAALYFSILPASRESKTTKKNRTTTKRHAHSTQYTKYQKQQQIETNAGYDECYGQIICDPRKKPVVCKDASNTLKKCVHTKHSARNLSICTAQIRCAFVYIPAHTPNKKTISNRRIQSKSIAKNIELI